MDALIDFVLIPAVKIVVVFLAISGVVAYLTLFERKVIAFMQVRLGPMRVGPHGLLQPLADGLKLMLKEDIIPSGADKLIFSMAPIITLIPAFIVFSVIPFGPSLNIFGRDIPFYITDLNIGILFVLAVSSIGIIGVILGGWASNSKYPLLGALRSAAQMVSYEVALGFSIIGVLMLSGTLSLVEIVEAQRDGVWFVVLQPVAFILFWICGVAETNRAPFDLPEAESELVAGFHTEYSGFRFSLFFLAEYAAMIVIASMAVTLFWGGWLPPFDLYLPVIPEAIQGLAWFCLKVLVFLYFYLWFRATWPRFRYDHLMGIGWRILLPLAIANVIVTAILMLVFA
jgi:NADH-quinone oxidoreductase subunit H